MLCTRCHLAVAQILDDLEHFRPAWEGTLIDALVFVDRGDELHQFAGDLAFLSGATNLAATPARPASAIQARTALRQPPSAGTIRLAAILGFGFMRHARPIDRYRAVLDWELKVSPIPINGIGNGDCFDFYEVGPLIFLVQIVIVVVIFLFVVVKLVIIVREKILVVVFVFIIVLVVIVDDVIVLIPVVA